MEPRLYSIFLAAQQDLFLSATCSINIQNCTVACTQTNEQNKIITKSHV